MKKILLFFLIGLLFFSCSKDHENADASISDADIVNNSDDEVTDEEPFSMAVEPVLCKKRGEECENQEDCCYGNDCTSTGDKPPICVEHTVFGKEEVQDAKYSPDGKIIAIISEEFLRFYDAETKEEISSINCGKVFYNIVFSVDGSVAFVFNKNEIVAYRVSDGARYYDSVIDGDNYLYDYALSSSGRYLLIAKGLNFIDVIDLSTGKIIKTVKTSSADIMDEYSFVMFTSDDKKIVGGKYKANDGHSGTISIWDFDTKAFEKRIDVCVYGSLTYDLVPGEDPDQVIVACYDGSLNKVSIEQGKIIEVNNINDHEIEELAVSKDFKKVAALCKLRTIKIIDTKDLSVERTFTKEINIRNLSFGSDYNMIGVDNDDYDDFYYTEDGTETLYSESVPSLQTFILDASEGKVTDVIERDGPVEYLASIDLLKDNDTVFSMSVSGEMEFISLKEQKLKKTYSVPTGNGNIVEGAITGDGEKAAFFPQYLGPYVYDFEEEKAHGMTGESCLGLSYYSRLAFSDNGNLLAVIRSKVDNCLCVYNLEKNEVKKIDETGNVIQFSPDSQILGIGGDRIVLWNYDEDSEIYSYTEENLDINSLNFSQDGKKIAAVDGYNRIFILDIESDKIETEFSLADDGDPIYFITFSPDGKTIATLSRYGEISLFDIVNKKKLSVISKMKGSKFTTREPANVKLDFNNDGTKIIVLQGREIHSLDISYILE